MTVTWACTGCGRQHNRRDASRSRLRTCSTACDLAARVKGRQKGRDVRAKALAKCANPACDKHVKEHKNTCCSRACGRVVSAKRPFAKCANPNCSNHVKEHKRAHCSRACELMMRPKRAKPGSKPADICIKAGCDNIVRRGRGGRTCSPECSDDIRAGAATKVPLDRPMRPAPRRPDRQAEAATALLALDAPPPRMRWMLDEPPPVWRWSGT